MSLDRLYFLYKKCLDQADSPEERAELFALLQQEGNEVHASKLFAEFFSSAKSVPVSDEVRSDILNNIFLAGKSLPPATKKVSSAAPVHRMHLLRRGWVRYAAAVIILVSVGAYLWITRNNEAPPTAIADKSVDIAPGTNRASLTVGNNNPISLSNNKTGITVGEVITYNDGERIAEAGQVLLLSTPRGGQYQAVLPDGTRVWLNAASSIQFPSRFSGDKREVQVSGEVYMEVAQNSKSPFSVKAGNTVVQVLGTSFNINAYPDEESQKTTLISGAVKVIAAGRSDLAPASVMLKPGEVADVKDGITVKKADPEQTMAWKNGYFSLQNATVPQVMKQLERWYDIHVKYQETIPAIIFKGRMQRNIHLSDVINFLSETGVACRLEGKTLIVL